MLQRAASNAYSWWWASHIRTKQSKWLEQNLQDMEEKVQSVLKLIEEDGDSFAKRAEMYYKKRPELIHFVEDSYRAYRALAERYDHISTELQNANNTIASVFPEQVQFAMEEDEDEASPRFPKKPHEVSKPVNVPKVPVIPKDLKGMLASSAMKKLQPKMSMNVTASSSVANSGLSKDEGLREIDRLQKEILALQTEKEFVKSSYEGGLAKYWEIEEQIIKMQEKVCGLQDEFGSGIVIEDDDARTLMASAALKSCQESLSQLQEKQERSVQDAAVERTRIINARERLKSLKDQFTHGHAKEEIPQASDEFAKEAGEVLRFDQDIRLKPRERQDLELLSGKIKEHFEVESNSSLTVTELAEKIDELVNKVINLEAAVSSQAGLITRLRTETDELQAQIRALEDNKSTLISGKNDLSEKLKEMETKLRDLQDLDLSVEVRNNNLQTHFAEARFSLDHLSEKLHFVMPDELEPREESKARGDLNDTLEDLLNVMREEELIVSDKSCEGFKGREGSVNLDNLVAELEVSNSSQKEEESRAKNKSLMHSLNKEEKPNHPDVSGIADTQASTKTADEQATIETRASPKASNEEVKGQDGEPDWKHLFTNAMENREKILLAEYTAVLRNFKEVKKKLAESEKKNEKKNGDSLFDTMVKLRELRTANAKKDEQIRALRRKLNRMQEGISENEQEKPMPTESPKKEREITEELKLIVMDHQEPISEIEEKFWSSIDQVLEENLNFWLRFSTTLHQIQKFETEVKDLQSELLKLEEKQKKQDGSSTWKYSLKSDAKPLYKHLREIQAELAVWLEKSSLLKDELKNRFSSLCAIQEEITAALKASAEDDDFRFRSHQAAKFQGEILNMKQENNKVADELQAGLDHMTTLQLEVERTLARLNEEFKLSGSKNRENIQLHHSESRSRVPLRSFIFGIKAKKQKHSFFSCVHPALHLHRKYSGFRSSGGEGGP